MRKNNVVCLRDNCLTEDQILFHYKTIYYVQGNEIIELKDKELEYEIKHLSSSLNR